MRLNEIEYTDSLPIDGYGPGFFRIGGGGGAGRIGNHEQPGGGAHL